MLGPFQIEIRPATYDVTRYRRQASRNERRGRRQGGPGREEEEGQRGTGKETRERGRRGEAEDKVAPEQKKKGKGEKGIGTAGAGELWPRAGGTSHTKCNVSTDGALIHPSVEHSPLSV